MAQTEDLDSIRFLEAGMAAGSHGVWGHGLVPTPGEAELARLRERFRGHHIFHDVRWDREVRYLAYRAASGVQPDTVITDDLAELREQLEQAAPPDLGTGLFLLFAQEPGIGDPDACQWSSGPNPAVPAVDTGLAGSTRRWRSTGTAQRRAACGTLSSPAGLHRAELGGIAIKAALERAALFTANPDDVIIGQVLQALLRDARVIHRFAPYALVRGALENACAAVWMLEPPRRADRLARRLRLAIDDVRNGEQARQLTGQQGPRTRKDRLDDIAAVAVRAGLDEEALKNRVSYTEIVKAVDASGAPGSLIEFSWKICSGLTHGDSWAAWSASRMTQMPSPVQDGVATLKMEASLSLLMQMTTLAVRLTGRGWQLHDQRCQSPYLSSAIAHATR